MSRTSDSPKLASIALAIFTIAFTCIVAAAQNAPSATNNVTGFWVFRVPTGDGNFRESFFDLKQDGGTVTGEFIQGTRKLPSATAHSATASCILW